MTEKREFKAIKGTRDILPPDSALWNWFEQTARDVFESYNFREIRLPIFEETELFARAVGSDSDIVGKEMFTFPDPSILSNAEFRAGWEKLKELTIAYDSARGTIDQHTQENILSQARLWTLAAFTAASAPSISEATENDSTMPSASICWRRMVLCA